MIKKTASIFFYIFLLTSVIPGIAEDTVSTLKYRVVDNKEITINIWMIKKKATLYLMGNHMFDMDARYITSNGSSGGNIIVLTGDSSRKLYLNRGSKTLYFPEGTGQMKGKFANVSVQTKTDGTIQVEFTENEGIDLNLDMEKQHAVMYFKGNLMFKMSAESLPIRGFIRDNLIELKGNGYRKIHLNRGSKILYFREGNKGTFASVVPR